MNWLKANGSHSNKTTQPMQPMQTSALGRNREFDVTKTYVVSEFKPLNTQK